MITISSPMKQDDIVATVEAIDKYNYKLESKKGIDLSFSVDTEDIDDAIAVAKSAIKESEYGSALYFSVRKEGAW